MKRALVLTLLLMVAGVADVSAQAAPPPPAVGESFSDPVLESRARHLQRQLRCMVCQSESIDESRSTLAADLRRLVREQLAAGKTDQEVQDFLFHQGVIENAEATNAWWIRSQQSDVYILNETGIPGRTRFFNVSTPTVPGPEFTSRTLADSKAA